MKNEKIKMKEMKNQKLKIKNGKIKIPLICTKQLQTLMRPEKNVEKKLYKRSERCTRPLKILGKLYKTGIRKQKARKQKKQRLEHIAQMYNCAFCLRTLLEPITCGGIKNVYKF